MKENPPQATIITADGKCISNPVSDPDTLEVVFDGNRMIGGRDSTTLIGKPGDYLPQSIHYRLTTFEPQQDGTCVARYEKRNQ